MADINRETANARRQTNIRSQSAYSKQPLLRPAKDKIMAGKPLGGTFGLDRQRAGGELNGGTSGI